MAGRGEYICARCPYDRGERTCDAPGGKAPDPCPTEKGAAELEAARETADREPLRRMLLEAGRQEGEGYAPAGDGVRPVKTRVEETIEYARRMGYDHIGIAFCAGLREEARLLETLLRDHGFRVTSVVCKVGCVPKEETGLADAEKIRPGGHESACNPVGQAAVLNAAGTRFNIAVGLCVGHDAVFLSRAEAPTTVLAAKDRLLGHNPLAALYTGGSYYRSLSPKTDGAFAKACGGRAKK